jgi:hypothetical protein
MREDRRHLLWFLNNLLFRLEDLGALPRLRDRWLKEEYKAGTRAANKRLPVSADAKQEQETSQLLCQQFRIRAPSYSGK